MEIVRLENAKQWPELSSLSPDQMKEAYALARAAFTAADLQKFTEVEEGVPMEAFLEAMERKQHDHDRKPS